MSKEYRHDLGINGSGSSTGGLFQNVRINGEGTVTNDLDCLDFRVNGTGRVMGNVKAKHIKVNGVTVIEGAVDSEQLIINGQTDIGGDLSVRQLKLHGKSDIGGNLTGDRLEIGGELTVQMDCEAEAFVAKGSFDIGGLLNAGNVEIHLYGPCKVREIGGETIQVRRSGFGLSIQKIIHSLFPSFENRLTVDTIEGDDIYLEYTTAKVVRGIRVNIGPGCEIASIEYKDHFEQDKGAKVSEHNQL
jgi:cytoskeletal protein CcmA (bactofilin family)